MKLEIDDDDVAKTVELKDDVAVDSTKCKLWIDDIFSYSSLYY